MTSSETTSTVAAGSEATLQHLERRLWDAANALRGPVDPSDFKTYVFPVLFWKWMSDHHAYNHARAVADFGDEDGLVDEEIEADYQQFVIPEGCRWEDVVHQPLNLGVRIGEALGRIEQANPDRLANIFGDAAWGNQERLPDSALSGLVQAFDVLQLTPDRVSNDVLGQAYEYLLKQFADVSGKKAGEFFTPREVVHLLVGILDPQEGETIHDPASGSGGMLVETINVVRERGDEHKSLRLYAQEVNLTTSAIARMNLFLHEIKDFSVYRGDTLRNPKHKNTDGSLQQFDVTIANPPFSLQNWGHEVWADDPRSVSGMPPAKNGDYAWIQHMIATMRPETGRVGVVMPHGVLFRGGAEGKIRKSLIESDLLEAVIGLPAGLFYSTSIPACILVFRATKPEDRKDHVLFVDGSARFTKGKNQNHMTDEDQAMILEAYKTGVDPDGPDGVKLRLVSNSEITDNDYDLNLGRYIQTAAEETISVGEAWANYLESRGKRVTAEMEMMTMLSVEGYEVFPWTR